MEIIPNKVMFERVLNGECYYYITALGIIGMRIENGKNLDDLFYKSKNYFPSKEEAELYLKNLLRFRNKCIKEMIIRKVIF